MAITHINGFGTLPVTGDACTLTNATSGTSTFSRQAGRFGGYALRHSNGTANIAGTHVAYIIFAGPFTELSIGVAINHRAAWTPADDTLGFSLHTASNNWRMRLGTGAAAVYSNPSGTTAWTIADASPTGIGWHWWNFVYKYATSATGICALYRDGTLLASANGDTQDSITSNPPTSLRVQLGNANGGAQADIGDLVFKNDATVIPDTVVSSLFPDATSAGAWVGSDGNSVDNHLLINENPAYDAAGYVGAAGVGTVDTYTVGNLPNAAASITAVQASARAFKSDAGARTVATMLNAVQGTAKDPGGGATVYQLDTAGPWNTASVNALTVGIKAVS